MADGRLRTSLRSTYYRAALLVTGSTLVLTSSFIGALAFLEGATPGIGGRIAWYLVASGAVFVAAILLLESQTADGRRIIVSATVVTVTAFVLIVLSVEGLLFAVRNHTELLVSQLVLYFVAAGLLATGFGYWTLNHWREFTAE